MRCLLSLILGAVAAMPATAAEPLPSFNVAADTAAVAGVSSGGAMAVQLHVAYSATFTRGAAVFAGAPYDCAQGSALRATSICMKAVPTPPDVQASVRITDERARAGAIDPTSHLTKSHVYLFSGTKDAVVRPPVMDALQAYYRRYVPAERIRYENTVPASHAWVSPGGPQQCDALGKLFLNQCGVDTAEQFLTMFYGALKPKSDSATLRGRLVEFDQAEFFDDRKPGDHSVAGSGWAFVPADCAAGQACRVLVALHGCLQSYDKVGDAFVRGAGLNEWADTNQIVVLYPQAAAKLKGNPNGCWDWWGYDDPNYAIRRAPQMRAIKAMVDRVSKKAAGR